jgi:hypothetical protein
MAVGGFAHVAVTITGRTDVWLRILRGEPVPPGMATHLIPAGSTFDPALHCDFVKDAAHPVFRRLAS